MTDRREPPPGVDATALDALLEALESQSTRSALVEQFGTDRDGYDIRKALFRSGATAWRVPVSTFLQGRCLDVNCGFGTRACLLAELVDEVYAVDSSPDALRFLSARDDYATADSVTPIHAGAASLPDPDVPFDVVVVDCTGRNRPDDLEATLERLRSFLSSDGVLLVLFDGWLRRSGLTNLLGIGEPTPAVTIDPRGVFGSTASAGSDLLGRLGFDAVDRYALVPDAADTTFCFRVDDADAVAQLLETELDPTTTRERLLRRLADVVQGTAFLEESYPAYLAVCRDSTAPGVARTGLVVGGSTRVVVLDGVDGRLESISKVPTRSSHAPYVAAEEDVLEALDVEEGPLEETFPRATTSTTRLGPTRIETPVAGRPLVRYLDDDVDSLEAVLESGLGWLATFQRHYGGEPTTREPETVEASLSIPELGVSPPPIDQPMTLFETPVHGDYHPKNIFVDGSRISAVIDWELATLAGNPVVDAGLFVLQTVGYVFGGIRAGVDAAVASATPHADVVADALSTYCDTVGLSRRAVVTCLPIVWIYRIRTAADRNATTSYTERELRRAADARYVFDRIDDVHRVLGSTEFC